MVKGEETLRNTIQVVITTQLGERAVRPLFGCNLRPFIFKPATANLLTEIESEISTTLKTFCRKCTIQDVTAVFLGTADGLVEVTVDYLSVTSEIKSMSLRFSISGDNEFTLFA